MYTFQGMSPRWWNDLHFRHHSKPNVVSTQTHLYLIEFHTLIDVLTNSFPIKVLLGINLQLIQDL